MVSKPECASRRIAVTAGTCFEAVTHGLRSATIEAPKPRPGTQTRFRRHLDFACWANTRLVLSVRPAGERMNLAPIGGEVPSPFRVGVRPEISHHLLATHHCSALRRQQGEHGEAPVLGRPAGDWAVSPLESQTSKQPQRGHRPDPLHKRSIIDTKKIGRRWPSGNIAAAQIVGRAAGVDARPDGCWLPIINFRAATIQAPKPRPVPKLDSEDF